MPELPGGRLSRRPVHFIWIADCSYSMKGDKIESLNEAIRQSIPAMRTVAKDNPNAEVLVRAVKFSSGAEWHVAQPTPVESFQWQPLLHESSTDMGAALSLVGDAMRMPPMESRALPPVLVLISDGMPTDDFNSGLNRLMSEPWGKKAVRISIAIGQDADTRVLQKFIGNVELEPLVAKNAAQLAEAIRWTSTSVLKSASAPMTQAADGRTGLGAIPAPRMADAADEADDVW